MKALFAMLLGLGLVTGAAFAGDVVIPPPADVREEAPPPVREEVRVEHHWHDVHCAYGVSEHFTLVYHKDAAGHVIRSYSGNCGTDKCGSGSSNKPVYDKCSGTSLLNSH